MSKIYKPDGRCNISGERVKEERLRAGLSQEQLAYKLQIIGLDVTQKVISRIENGSRVVADYELDYLATALGTTINHLLGKECENRTAATPCGFFVEKRGKMLKICRIMLDIIEQMLYNIITGKG